NAAAPPTNAPATASDPTAWPSEATATKPAWAASSAPTTAWPSVRATEAAVLHYTHECARDVAIIEALPLHILYAVAQFIFAEPRKPVDLALLPTHRNRLRC